MPYTSHGHPYGLMDTDQPRPGAVARCGGPKVCSQCASQAVGAPELTDAQRHAARIISELPAIVDWDLVHDRITDAAGEGEGTIDRAGVLAAIDSATVTASWPQGAERAEGGQ